MMQPLVIRLPENDKKRLEIKASQGNTTIAELARRAIQVYLGDKPEKENGAEVLIKWATRKNKSIKKNPINSTNYKDYLYGPKSKKFGDS